VNVQVGCFQPSLLLEERFDTGGRHAGGQQGPFDGKAGPAGQEQRFHLPHLGVEKVAHRVVRQVDLERKDFSACQPGREGIVVHDAEAVRFGLGLEFYDGGFQPVGVLEAVGVGVGGLAAHVVGGGKDNTVVGSHRFDHIAACQGGGQQLVVPAARFPGTGL